MNALWWWIDRWRKSTAYMDMTLEEQGAYRNLLDEATLRGGALPNDDRILAKACGDARAWKRVRAAVLRRFTLQDDGLHNETLDSVLHQSERRREKQARYRNKDGNANGNERGNGAGNKPGSPDPDLSRKNPPNPPAVAGGKFTRRELADARKDLDAFVARQPAPFMGPLRQMPANYQPPRRCPHEPECDDEAVCLARLAHARRAKMQTVFGSGVAS